MAEELRRSISLFDKNLFNSENRDSYQFGLHQFCTAFIWYDDGITHSVGRGKTGRRERQPLTDKSKTDLGNVGKSLDPVYQSVNP
ncbi:hypothetical protein T265_00473 [Opisthorchis viverrini]|uniref:Uncharacterized protein n=1 Tax=Opisthorchis viverrini TaxID=6198 RepID=A0A075AJQ8_OPIVI|nr:hypothetical protein T265_00473 [Opisthorchis viverrini]KER33809.1 hypothetical protein T265_00473 [Opisthorchis viverrini]